jgi:anaerobic magnesium-protoporphyrin IX monomethyl ester cyclase
MGLLATPEATLTLACLRRLADSSDTLATAPELVLLGHSGSTSAHPRIAAFTRQIRARSPAVRVVVGGVYPTYHWREVLDGEPAIEVVVRGEGEAAVVSLVEAMVAGRSLLDVPGLALRVDGVPACTGTAPVLANLDEHRVGWELIDPGDYSYWGGRRAVVAQFSRGCPHRCTYCGQYGFWRTWRHRDPVRFARELAWLHRDRGVALINLADENPTADRDAWRQFLEALVAEDVRLELVGSTRAADIVRDADLLPLYRRAGVVRFLLGTESTDEATLKAVKKGSTATIDREAIRLLRGAGILSMATWVAGLSEQTDADYWRGLRQLLAYDPDQVQLLFATPHRWTPYFREVAERRVIVPDASRWDYKHQVMDSPIPAWRVLAWTKGIEVALQARPKALWRTLLQPDPQLRHAMRWYGQMGRRVWPHEIAEFVRSARSAAGPTVGTFWSGGAVRAQAQMST